MPTDQHCSRRRAIATLGGGFGSLVLADLLCADDPTTSGPLADGGNSSPLQSGKASTPDEVSASCHFPGPAKHVIFLFMGGGPSHLDLLDPKPLIQKYAGQRPASVQLRTERKTGGLLPSPFRFSPHGECGTEVSELLPHLAGCVDDMCVVRSIVGGNPNHAPAANWVFSGRIDQIHPSIGAWTSYGLGSANRNLPHFVSLKQGSTASRYVRNGYLPGRHQATPINIEHTTPEKMVTHLRNQHLTVNDQRRQFEFIQQLNRHHQATARLDSELEARIQAMETAYHMQFAAGEACSMAQETESTRAAYGEGWFANGCLLARRLVERGVRYIHLEHSRWDHHDHINRDIRRMATEIDQPIAALLKDLKQRGLLDETLVVWGGEFGRTPVSENGDGRDHNHYGFTMWLAGGGIRGGMTYGNTDEFGFKAVENRVTVHDLHATLLHQLGLDHERLTYRYSGRDFRLTDVHGSVIQDVIA